MSFIGKMQKTADNKYNMSITENGAVGYKTTGSSLLDMNFKVSSYRNMTEEDIIRDFRKCFNEDSVLAVKWLFYVRDAREGQGERRLFRTVIKDMSIGVDKRSKYNMENLVKLIPEYGRFDDLFCLLDTTMHATVMNIIRDQLIEDMKNMKEGKSISLLGKWMPSENASSLETKKMAYEFINFLRMSPKKYRKMLSMLRSYIDVTEVKMSGNNWHEIDYEKVPSRANLIYKDAFMKHDAIRRNEYLQALQNGEAKINASVLYPHDIVHKYNIHNRYGNYVVDTAIEEMWKNIPNLVNGNDSTIVVADGSGSMCTSVGNTKVSALEVANSLAIYFAERCNGEFRDKYITFSSRPQIVDLGTGDGSLLSKIKIALQHSECSNTNVEAVFKLILDTAVENHMTQEEIPHNILIISDMEFDGCVETYSSSKYGYGYRERNRVDAKLFDTISGYYEQYGYKIPKLIFWNVNSRTGTIPMKENNMGVTLVSGFSVNTMKMIMSNKTDPYQALLEVINSERYAPVGKAMGVH